MPLEKVGKGQLIITQANTTYTSNIEIAAGWITIENSQSLGGFISADGQAAQPVVTIDAGAALHLLPLSGNLTLTQNFNINGSGITDTAYPLIDNSANNPKNGGSILSLAGNNVIDGNIELNQQDGIGTEQIFSGNPSDPNFSANAFSQLTLAGEQEQPPPPKGFSVTGTATGGSHESDNIINVGATGGTLTIDFNPLTIPDDCRVYYGPFGTPGSTLLYASSTGAPTIPCHATCSDPGGTFGVITVTWSATSSTASAVPSASATGWNLGPVVQHYGPLASTQIEIIIDQGGGPFGTAWNYTASIVPAVTAAAPNGITKLGSQRLIIDGNGVYTGAFDIKNGAVRDQNNTGLGAGTAFTSVTTVESGASLELAATDPNTNGGLITGLDIYGEDLVLNGTGNGPITGSPLNTQTLELSGMSAAAPKPSQFTLSFEGATSNPITYTGTAADALAIQNALNLLPTIDDVQVLTFKNLSAGDTYEPQSGWRHECAADLGGDRRG